MAKNYNETLQNNNLDLESILDTINSLPEAGGTELPELTNEGTAADLLEGKQLIDSEGNIVTGTIETFDGSYTCSGESTGGEEITEETNVYTEKLVELEMAITALENELEGKASGGGASIEAWTGTINTNGGGLGYVSPTLYYMDETLTPIILGNGDAISETITIAANTVLYFSRRVDTALSNAEDITSYNDSNNYNCTVIRPTSNNFSVSRA